jgi:hypothetical protein
MKYKPTILNVSAILFLAGIMIYTIWNYKILSHDEGWGMVAMVVFTAFAAGALVLDRFLQKFITNKWILNSIGLLVSAGIAIALFGDFT